MKISDFIGETTAYDKKVRLEENRPKSWLKSVSAFANGVGGFLVFGISDNDELIGVENASRGAEKISEIINAKMDPVPTIHLQILKEGGMDFIVLQVFPGDETPYYYSSDGNLIAYVRVGNESIQVDALTLRRLIMRGVHLSFDSEVSRWRYADFSFTRLKSAYKSKIGEDFADSDFLSFDLVNGDRLTNAGALFADDCPIRWSRLFCTRWNGLDKASGVIDALDDKEYGGSLIALLENGMDFVRNNTRKKWKKTENGRVEMPEYPMLAVHEAVVNALIHRDYMEVGSEVHIDIFDDRMEIYSPGGMLDGSFVQDLNIDQVASKRRNPVIADLFGRMHFMERRGSGFRKIRREYHRVPGLSRGKEPVFTSSATSFFVTLYNLNYGDSLMSNKKVAHGDGKVAHGDGKVAHGDGKVAHGDGKVAHEDGKVALEECMMVHGYSVRERDRVFQILETYGFEADFRRKDLVRQFELAPSSVGKFLRKLKQTGLIVSGNGHGLYRMNGNCAVKGEEK